MASFSYKLFALAVLLIMAAAAEASAFRKTIMTVEETLGSNDGEMERCRKEMRRYPLGACRAYMRYGRSELLTAVSNQEVPQQCCEQLSKMREDCRCPCITEMTRQMMQGRAMREEEMLSRAENLPSMCGMRPSHCRIRLISY